ncbi:MAG TPA: penicillin-binding transpeptidase domain-containing protein [Chloroflexota bacterium]|nr:penicillin-binding transpeptidase domain-containing protein [Chloroflexota bacterium]
METKHPATRHWLPEDDPNLAGLVADLRVLHQVSPPRGLQQRLAPSLKQRLPLADGAIMFTGRKRPGDRRAGGARWFLGQWSAAAIFITVLGLASGALTFTARQAGAPRLAISASGLQSGIPKGARIKLTIDNFVQAHIVEPKLANLLHQFGAVSGTIVVERPSDGAIIAMASQPNHDPRTWRQLAASNAFGTSPNPADSDAYTPGQTIMPLLTGIGLDTGSFDERTVVNDTGTLKTDGLTIQNWCLDSCGFGGPETVAYMLRYASNIAATQFAKLIPDQQFYQYLDNFGFGQRQTGPGLPEANPGMLIEPYTTVRGKKVPNHIWRPAYRDLTAFGQGVPSTPQPAHPGWTAAPNITASRQAITATPLQVVNAYAALANGGTLMRPRLIQSYTLDGKTTVIQPTVLHVVFQHADTAQRVTNILVQAEAHGEACEALVPGYDVAAKTSTVRVYNSPRTIGSTVAYGPIGETDPAQRFVVLIELTFPNLSWGSETAAPATGEILRQLFQHYGRRPDPKHTQPGQLCVGPDQ